MVSFELLKKVVNDVDIAKTVYNIELVVLSDVEKLVAVLMIVEYMAIYLMLGGAMQNILLSLSEFLLEVKGDILSYLDNFQFIPSLRILGIMMC